jgi:1,2-dihydroxy-3-keto-5-methylthiopentene dioxygenase
MSKITVYADDNPQLATSSSDEHSEIAKLLSGKGVRFERWSTDAEIHTGQSQDEIIAAYQGDINRLIETGDYQTVDVVSLSSDHPDKAELRRKFLSEHRHNEDELRFFVAGQGLFFLHIEDNVYEVLCEQGDLISVPANTPHWFDMGPNPNFTAIRLFNNPEGWVAHYSGSEIADHFNRLEN